MSIKENKNNDGNRKINPEKARLIIRDRANGYNYTEIAERQRADRKAVRRLCDENAEAIEADQKEIMRERQDRINRILSDDAEMLAELTKITGKLLKRVTKELDKMMNETGHAPAERLKVLKTASEVFRDVRSVVLDQQKAYQPQGNNTGGTG